MAMRAGREQYEYLTGPELHDRLKTVDPLYAARLHPNDKRKITR